MVDGRLGRADDEELKTKNAEQKKISSQLELSKSKGLELFEVKGNLENVRTLFDFTHFPSTHVKTVLKSRYPMKR